MTTSNELSETDQQMQNELSQMLYERFNRAIVKTLVPFVSEHPGYFGIFALICIRMLFFEAGRLLAALIDENITDPQGGLKSRALLEGLAIAERSEQEVYATEVRKLLVEILPVSLETALKTGKKHDPLAFEIREELDSRLMEMLMDED